LNFHQSYMTAVDLRLKLSACQRRGVCRDSLGGERKDR
jgi:hypothetical protein